MLTDWFVLASDLHVELSKDSLWVRKPFVKLGLLDRPEGDKWRQIFLESKVKSDPTQIQQLIASMQEEIEYAIFNSSWISFNWCDFFGTKKLFEGSGPKVRRQRACWSSTTTNGQISQRNECKQSR